jgi:hypothetical protein
MDYNLVELEYSRLHPHIGSLKLNHYPDKRIYYYQKSLFELYTAIGVRIENDDFCNAPSDELLEMKQLLVFIKASIECLKDSVLNLLPFETIFCLEAALKEWVTDDAGVENVLVTTNQYNDYFFWGILSLDEELFSLIASKYRVQFKQRLILISIPKFELNDYLSNVVLYHELGHFIETKYHIVDRIIETKHPGFDFDNPVVADLEKWKVAKEKKQLAEFFCDLFAAQYIKNCSSLYLNYVAYKNPESFTHPATDDRIRIVEDFLNNKANPTVAELSVAAKKATSKSVQIRYKSLENHDFINLVPVEIRTESELHFLYVLGWDLWLTKQSHFNSFKKDKIYEIINNLIEKSISNFIITKTWKQTDVSE